MDPVKPDFQIVERTLEKRLQALGLSVARRDGRIATGYERFELRREETQVAEVQLDDEPSASYLASVELAATLEHDSVGSVEIRDLVTQYGESMEHALESCANTFMDVTFPALESLFTSKPGEGTGEVTMSSFSLDLDRAIQWQLYLGRLQILNDDEGLLAARLRETPAMGLMLDTFTGYLSEPRLHWCRLYGASSGGCGMVFGCSIDGHKAEDAEAEMAHKFGEPVPGDWVFRHFFVAVPCGDVDEATTAKLRAEAARQFPPESKRKSWWSRLLGR